MADGYEVLLVILKLLIWNYHFEVLWANYSKTELLEDYINKFRNVLEWKLVCDLI
jgi:hypothetical protein